MHKLESLLGQEGSRLWGAVLESVVQAAHATNLPMENTGNIILRDHPHLVDIVDVGDNEATIVVRVTLQKYELVPANAIEGAKLMVDLINNMRSFTTYIGDFMSGYLNNIENDVFSICLESVDVITGKQNLIGGLDATSGFNFVIYASLTFYAEKFE